MSLIEKSLFITGTGTQVGKSVVTALLAAYFKRQSYSVITQKWVQSGGNPTEDLETHWKWMNDSCNPYPHLLPWMAPYSFKMPASPHLAAALEYDTIRPAHLIQTTTCLASQFDIVLVEGSGGLMVPIKDHSTWRDLLSEYPMPTVIVTENTLGCINHTLLTIHALNTAQIPILGIVYNHLPTTPVNLVIQKNNIQWIEENTQLPTLAVIPVDATPDLVEWKLAGFLSS